jgi:hypothetical protein
MNVEIFMHAWGKKTFFIKLHLKVLWLRRQNMNALTYFRFIQHFNFNNV